MSALEDFGIEYLIVGGVAVGFQAEPWYTKGLDVLVGVVGGSVRGLGRLAPMIVVFDRFCRYAGAASGLGLLA